MAGIFNYFLSEYFQTKFYVDFGDIVGEKNLLANAFMHMQLYDTFIYWWEVE